MDLYYLNSSGCARADVLLGPLGLVIFELGLPMTYTGTAKLLMKTGKIYNKNWLIMKTLFWKWVN